MKRCPRRRLALRWPGILLLTACAPDEPVVRESAPADADVAAPAGAARARRDLTGVWIVTGHARAPSSSMDEREAAEWRGRTLRLVEWEAQAPGARCADPTYETTSETATAFVERFESWPASLVLPVSGGQVEVMTVTCEGSAWAAPGGLMIRTDAGRALTVWDGVFLSLERDAEAEAVDFRGVGNEPGWVVEVDEDRHIRFRYDYGQRQIVSPVPVRSDDDASGAVEYRATTDAGDLRVRIAGGPCADDMSGFPFPATVTVALGDRIYRGCGGPAPDGA